MSSTAVQRTTEKTGERIPDDPAELIDPGEHGQPCPLMVVEVDGTASPQISPQLGVTGRKSLRAQTCWEECNLVVIEKRDGTKITDRWTRARYGPRKDFEPYAAQAGMQMGFLNAEQTLFIADGARHNWELAMTHSPGGGADPGLLLMCYRPAAPVDWRKGVRTRELGEEATHYG